MRKLSDGSLFSFLPLGFSAAFALTLAGCGHGKLKPELEGDPRGLFAKVCAVGSSVKSAKGSVWLKARSKEASGQLPGVVDAPSADRLRIEVMNLIGGTEAILTVEGRRYKIEVPNHKDRTEHGESTWGGIPLQWANALFLGRVPCPSASRADDVKFSRDEEGALVVETGKTLDRLPERFVYRLRVVEGEPWPESLHWERQGIGSSAPVKVDFKFEDPDGKTRSPLKWEAKSPEGEVKVKWKDRQVDTVASVR